MATRLLAFSGSLRKDSFNQKLAAIAAEGAREAGAEVTLISLRDFPLPLMDEDLEAAEGMPAKAQQLKDLFLAHDGLIIACPEYNSSITPALKNALDWVSRRQGSEPRLAAYRNKVAGLVAASPGALGGLRGLVHVRAILSAVGVLVIPEQIAISNANTALSADGQLIDQAQLNSVRSIGARVAEVTAKMISI